MNRITRRVPPKVRRAFLWLLDGLAAAGMAAPGGTPGPLPARLRRAVDECPFCVWDLTTTQ